MAKQKKEKKKGGRARTVVIVIVVIIVIAIIGSAIGGNDDESDSETEAMTEAVTEAETVAADAVAEEETEAVIVEEITEEEVAEVETEEAKAEKAWKNPLDHIASYDYKGTEEDPDRPGKTIMFWNVYFDEDAEADRYMNEQYKDILISCMQQPESRENEADEFGIQGFDSDNNLEFSWLSYDDKYTVTQYIWRPSQTNPDTYDWKFTAEDYNDIISAKTEDDRYTEEVTEAAETEISNNPLDHITEYSLMGIEEDPYGSGDIYMFWDVYFDEGTDTNLFGNNEYKEIFISCMQQPETKENNADAYAIDGFDSEGKLAFAWTSYEDKYTITKYMWDSSKTNPDTLDYKLSIADYDEVISAKVDSDSEMEFDTEIVDEENESESEISSDWDAGGLAYLDMSRDELLAIYNDYDKLISEEAADMTGDEAQAYEDESAEQVASEYGITADDVNQIFNYGSEPNYFATFDFDNVVVPYGEVRNVAVNGSGISLGVKISSLASNEQTIEQNYYNVCDFIRKYAKNDYDNISYYALADTSEGDETNAVSFDLSGDIITTIATQDFPDNTLGDYVENLYILPSLQD